MSAVGIPALQGGEDVKENLEITVERVTVGAQPAGAMLAAAADPQLAPIIEQGFVMVVDPGFFSMDWLTLQDGQIVRSLSGTNMRAVSLVLERAAELIGRNAGGRVPRETLEHAVRSSAPTIFVAGQAFDFWPTLEAAAQEVGADSVREIVNQLRVEDRPLDLVLVTGGGADIYKSVLDAMLPGVRVQVMPNPVLANARGFWLCGS